MHVHEVQRKERVDKIIYFIPTRDMYKKALYFFEQIQLDGLKIPFNPFLAHYMYTIKETLPYFACIGHRIILVVCVKAVSDSTFGLVRYGLYTHNLSGPVPKICKVW